MQVIQSDFQPNFKTVCGAPLSNDMHGIGKEYQGTRTTIQRYIEIFRVQEMQTLQAVKSP